MTTHTIFVVLVCFCLVGRNEAGFGANPSRAAPVSKSLIQKVTSWKQLEFGFPSEQLKQQAITNGNLIEENATPIDVQPIYGKNAFRLLTSIPRFADGIPYTLAVATEQIRPNGPTLQPYPSWDMHNTGKSNVDCNKITSAFRVYINECNEMVVIDSGVVESDQICPPQLLIFDLHTDTLKQRYRFPENLYTSGASLFIAPTGVVKDPPPKGQCQQMKVYICDVGYYGIVIYDRVSNTAWRAENKFMFPNPDYGTHTIAGESFTLMDGIFTMVSDRNNLYFHPLASINEFGVPLHALNNKTAWDDNPMSYENDFQKLGKRNSECATEAIDSKGFVYCVTFNPIQLIAWHIRSPYTMKDIVKLPANSNELEFVSGMKVVRNPSSGSEELWLISIRFQKIAAGTLNKNEENFRILKRPLDDIQSYFDNLYLNSDLHNKLIFN